MNKLVAATETTLVNKMVALSEQNLTTGYLVPLFEAMGYIDVTYHGGVSEVGKDIIMWELDKFQERRLIVVQVKKFKFSASSSTSSSFSGLMNQLSQAQSEGVPGIDGTVHRPFEVLFVSPFAIDVRSLSSQFEGYKLLRGERIRILDGPHVARLLKEHAPKLLAKLGGARYAVDLSLTVASQNAELMKALESSRTIDLSNVYCDVKFKLIPIEIQQIQTSENNGTIDVEVDSSDFESIRDICDELVEMGGPRLVADSYEAITNSYNERTSLYESAEKDAREANQSIYALTKRIQRSLEEDEGFLKKATKWNRNIPKVLKSVAAELNEDQVKDAKHWVANFTKDSSTPKDHRDWFKTIAGNLPISLKNQNISAPKYNFKICSPQVELWLKEQISSLHRGATRLDNPDGIQIKGLLTAFELLVTSLRLLLKNQFTHRVAANREISALLTSLESVDLHIPIHMAFDAGLDLTILGSAGAGKTTALQMYARRRAELGTDAKLVIFVSLPAIVRKATSNAPHDVPELERLIKLYLDELRCNIDMSSLEQALQLNGAIVLFDSVDEAIGNGPWIIDAITQFRKRYPNSQVITSSRASGNFVSELPFLQLGLLPFSKEQRNTFISKWFDDTSTDPGPVLEHLERNEILANVVTNPLAATILCVLQEHAIALPVSEANLYKSRFDLLTGVFDRYKGVNRQKNLQDNLKRTAQTAAYELHSRRIREAPEKELRGWVKRRLGKIMSEDILDSCMEELISPCEVLIRGRTGLVDFG
ncbi:MAG: flagellar biosynthesis GTPase FlhF, partial [Pirellulaceae bacterium]